MDPKEEKIPQTESVNPIKTATPPVQSEEKKEPVHQVPEESVIKPKKVIVLYPTVILLILISVIAGYLGYQNYQLKRQFKDQVVQVPQPTETPQETSIPTTDPAADWEIYTNNSLGLSFKHPSDYVATKTAQTIKNKNTEIVKLDTPDGVETNSPIVSLSSTTTDLSIENFIENENDCPDDFDSCTPLKEGPITDSIQFEAINRNYGSIETLFKKEGVIYRFSISAREVNSTFTDEQKTLYNQILSTFEFVGNTEKAKECYDDLGCEGPPPCMTNPASQFCECMGGKSVTKENEDGQYGICTINGKELDEWEYFRQMNPEDNTYSPNN